MAQTLKSLTYEDIKIFCDQTLQNGTEITLEQLLAKFPGDSIDVIAYFQQWRQNQLNQSLATSSQSETNKPAIPASITQILQQEIAKLQANQAKEQQTLLAQQQDIEQFLITKSQKLQADLEDQAKFVDESHKQLKQQAQEFQNKLQQLTSDYSCEISTLKQHHQQSLVAQQQEHQLAIENIIKENDTQLAKLSAQITQLVEDKSQQEQLIAEKKKQYQENLTALTQSHQHELAELTSNHQNDLAKKQTDHLPQADNNNEPLEQQLAQEREKSANLQARFFNVSNSVTKDKAIKAKLQLSLEQANDKIAALKQQLLQYQDGTSIENNVIALEKAERMITVLRNENNKLANQLENIKTNSVATIERLTGKSDQAITRIQALEAQLELEIQANSSVKEERVKLQEQIELIKQNQVATFERLTNNAEQAKAKIKALEQQLAKVEQ